MSTLKKNKRIKRAKKLALYGDLKPVLGYSLSQRGKAKYLGGNGRKTTGITRRAFRKNLQEIRVMEDGRVVRRRVPVSLIRSGLVTKPIVKAPFTIDDPRAKKLQEERVAAKAAKAKSAANKAAKAEKAAAAAAGGAAPPTAAPPAADQTKPGKK